MLVKEEDVNHGGHGGRTEGALRPVSAPRLTLARLVFAGLVHHRRAHLGAALASAVACAALAGALLVGDSVRGTLRSLAVERLGGVDQVLIAERPFTVGLAAGLAARPRVGGEFQAIAPALLLRGSAAAARPEGTGPSIGAVKAIGLPPEGFTLLAGPPQSVPGPSLRPSAPPFLPSGRRAVVNRRLADDLGVKAGDTIVIAIEPRGGAARESLAGRRDDPARSVRLDVLSVIEDRGAGLFSIEKSQRVPRNVYLDLAELSRALGLAGRANALLVSARDTGSSASREDGARLLEEELPRAAEVEDIGLKVEVRADRGFIQIESAAFQLDGASEEALLGAARVIEASSAPIFTYLANTIALVTPGKDRKEIPYSTVTALDAAAAAPLGQLAMAGIAPAPDPTVVPAPASGEILLGEWAAEDLGAASGDRVAIEYYVVESGGTLSTARAEFEVRGVAAWWGLADDRGLTPAFPGVTEARRLADWDPPFPVDTKRIRPRDEAYWEAHRATPKAFISLETGRRLWGNRFGAATAVRIGPARGRSLAETEKLLRAELKKIDAGRFGLVFRPVRAEALAASEGSADFRALFTAFSAFLIAAASLLAGLLWAIGLDRRAHEWGILRAVGFRGTLLRRLAAVEGLLVCGAGALVGLPFAPFYSRWLFEGLLDRFEAAMRPPRVELHAPPASLVLGFFITVAVVAACAAWSARRIARAAPRALLAGSFDSGHGARHGTCERRSRWSLAAAVVAGGFAALLAIVAALGFSGPAAFFGAGAALLAAGIFSLRAAMISPIATNSPWTGRGRARACLTLGFLNARRNPGRSTLTAGLVALAAFVVVAAGAVRRSGSEADSAPSGGTGGFSFAAWTDVPVFSRIDRAAGRAAAGIPSTLDGAPVDWTGVEPFGLRAAGGDDASCLNLYKIGTPRVLGAPPELVRRGGFRFHASEGEPENPWRLLEKPLADGTRPAILDEATATWMLHVALGETVEVEDGRGAAAKLRVVGLLSGSILQGSIIVSEADFLALFPALEGYRFFLIGGPAGRVERVVRALGEGLGRHGFDPVAARRLLEEFRSVELAYLETFRVLGGLGLLLGAVGLGAVLLRAVMERRGELALLRALGYRGGFLAAVVLAENALLVTAGLGTGALSALVAAAPHLNGPAAEASVSWGALAATLAGAAAIGLASGAAAVRAAVRSPIIPALRGE